ncbi:MAG TPA: hypothetical protein GXZ36_05155 [Firmicutes bacterium]|nr:hypothetical protein [Bacillota bacterium]
MVRIDLTLIGDGAKVLGCTGVSLKKQAAWLGQGLALAYGEQVTTVFLDINEDKENPLVKRACAKCEDWEYPLVLINGEVRYKAGLPLAALKALLEGMGVKPLPPGERGVSVLSVETQ